MGRLFRFVFKLLIFALVVFALTAAYLVYDGLRDVGDRTEIAVVPGMGVRADGTPGATLQARLDGAVQLYQQGHFPLIFVSGATKSASYDEAASMEHYLEAHGVPSDAIIADHEGNTTADTARNLAKKMKWKDLHSVMIVTNYYHVTRTKLALKEAGLTDISQSHVGQLQKEDAYSIAREVAAYYYYLTKFYLLPKAQEMAEQVQEEAPKVGDEIKKDSQDAKNAVDQKLNSLPKEGK